MEKKVTEKTYTIKVTEVVNTKTYKLKITNPLKAEIASINFGGNLKGLNNYIGRFLDRIEEEGF